MAKLHSVVERGHGTSTSMSSEWCGGARRPAWHLERGCPSTPWRIFGNISIRRKPAATSVAWVASGRRLRSTSGAHSAALLTPRLRRPHHEGFLKALRSRLRCDLFIRPPPRRGLGARPAHKFTRLNHSSGLSALWRNFSLLMADNPRRRHFRVRFEQFQRLAAPFPSRSTFLSWPTRFRPYGFPG
jgi:hypothetical protein